MSLKANLVSLMQHLVVTSLINHSATFSPQEPFVSGEAEACAAALTPCLTEEEEGAGAGGHAAGAEEDAPGHGGDVSGGPAGRAAAKPAAGAEPTAAGAHDEPAGEDGVAQRTGTPTELSPAGSKYRGLGGTHRALPTCPYFFRAQRLGKRHKMVFKHSRHLFRQPKLRCKIRWETFLDSAQYLSNLEKNLRELWDVSLFH